MTKKMSFSPQEIEILELNPYTHSVNDKHIRFTLAFKEFYMLQFQSGELSNAQIFEAAGYDPAILGNYRMQCVRNQILKQYRSPEGLRAPRGLSIEGKRASQSQQALEKAATDKQISELQKEIEHLKKQIDFLKKTELLIQQALKK